MGTLQVYHVVYCNEITMCCSLLDYSPWSGDWYKPPIVLYPYLR